MRKEARAMDSGWALDVMHKAMDEFEQTLPDDVHINTITDQSKELR